MDIHCVHQFVLQFNSFDISSAVPSEPQSLTVTTTATSAKLSWKAPISDGGRDDVFYKVKYKAAVEQEFTYYSPSPSITDTSATVTSLTPVTNYTFMVVAENGVSWEFHDKFVEGNRTSSVLSVATEEGGEHLSKTCLSVLIDLVSIRLLPATV